MITSLLTIAIGLGVMILVGLRKIGRKARRMTTAAEMISRMVPIDVEGFRNLMNPAETAFLREKLGPGKFRRAQRSRQFAAAKYILALAHNASIMLSVAESNLQNADPELAATARALARDALQLRMRALSALPRVYWCALFPSQMPAGVPIADGYQGLSARVGRFVSMRFPTDASTLSHIP